MSDSTNDKGKVVTFPASEAQEFTDHGYFLDVIKDTIADRRVANTIVLVLDKDGGFTVHTSSGDIERALAMCDIASKWCQSVWMRAIASMDSAGKDEEEEEEEE